MDEPGILVLGAYGLAGRAIVARLLAKTPYPVIASGRNPALLDAILQEQKGPRLQTRALDATDASALHDACAQAAFIINAVGPYAKSGEAIAQTVIACGKPYLDCANEQRHYRNLARLDSLAREKHVPLITAAGVVPGLSTLLAAQLLSQHPEANEAGYYWAQFRHAYAEAGLASMMGGILEAVTRPLTLHHGKQIPVTIGQSITHFTLPEPFGPRRFMELPAIDALTLPAQYPLHTFHSWFYMGDLPTWLLSAIRVLQPDRRPWAYRIIERIMRHINNHNTDKAIAAGIGPECCLHVFARGEKETYSTTRRFRDGAIPTACLPAHIANHYLQGKIAATGLLTPLDIIEANEIDVIMEGALC